MLGFFGFLFNRVSRPFNVSLRTNYSKKKLVPHVRPYRRRLWESTVKPYTPVPRLTDAQKCSHREEMNIIYQQKRNELGDLNMALVTHIRKQFRNWSLMAVCQPMPFSLNTFKHTRGLLQMENINIRVYPNKVMQYIIKDTKLAHLEPLFVGRNVLIFGQHPQQIKTIIDYSKKVKWYKVLACVVDDRILSLKECETLAQLPSLEVLPSHTVGILSGVSQETTRLLGSPIHQLTMNLENIKEIKKGLMDTE